MARGKPGNRKSGKLVVLSGDRIDPASFLQKASKKKLKRGKHLLSFLDPSLQQSEVDTDEAPLGGSGARSTSSGEGLPNPPRRSVLKPKQDPNNRKETETIVSRAIENFWDTAWNICAERFYTEKAPFTISDELRNCWLRIMEGEWQDQDALATRELKDKDVFKTHVKDEPPLPLAFDTWSRGCISEMPGYRRESVMDPYLRELKKQIVQVGPGDVCLPTRNPLLKPVKGWELRMESNTKFVCEEGTACRKGVCNCEPLEDGTVMGVSVDPEGKKTCRRVAGEKCSKEDQCFDGVQCKEGKCTWDEDTEEHNRQDRRKTSLAIRKKTLLI